MSASPERHDTGSGQPHSPLAAVTEALERAEERGELTAADLEWSLAQLTERPRGGDGESKGADRRQQILRVATEVFLRRGYRHATIEDVAGQLSLTKAGVYHYFASKQEILEAICDTSLAASEAVILDGVRGPGNPAERLRCTAEGYAELVMADKGIVVFVRSFEEVSEAAQAQLRNRCRRLFLLLEQLLEEGVSEGVFDVRDSALTALSLFGMVNWLSTWYRPEGSLSRDGIRDLLVGQVMRAVQSGDQETAV